MLSEWVLERTTFANSNGLLWKGSGWNTRRWAYSSPPRWTCKGMRSSRKKVVKKRIIKKNLFPLHEQSSEHNGLFQASSGDASRANWECLDEEITALPKVPKRFAKAGLVLPWWSSWSQQRLASCNSWLRNKRSLLLHIVPLLRFLPA